MYIFPLIYVDIITLDTTNSPTLYRGVCYKRTVLHNNQRKTKTNNNKTNTKCSTIEDSVFYMEVRKIRL